MAALKGGVPVGGGGGGGLRGRAARWLCAAAGRFRAARAPRALAAPAHAGAGRTRGARCCCCAGARGRRWPPAARRPPRPTQHRWCPRGRAASPAKPCPSATPGGGRALASQITHSRTRASTTEPLRGHTGGFACQKQRGSSAQASTPPAPGTGCTAWDPGPAGTALWAGHERRQHAGAGPRGDGGRGALDHAQTRFVRPGGALPAPAPRRRQRRIDRGAPAPAASPAAAAARARCAKRRGPSPPPRPPPPPPPLSPRSCAPSWASTPRRGCPRTALQRRARRGGGRGGGGGRGVCSGARPRRRPRDGRGRLLRPPAASAGRAARGWRDCCRAPPRAGARPVWPQPDAPGRRCARF